jgi:hypothetical protein
MKTMKAAKSAEKMRDWSHFRDMWVRVLEKQTGKGLRAFNLLARRMQTRERYSEDRRHAGSQK